ncbi:hypothetical protein [Paraferrimonas sp. SM1919]|uniref:hypothetical protein n=1 Tax=Paraferrimonas sp. SM1919 TaxID=2662263 RepID=UPI0013D84D8A|nr:hypothetical protein [Paraferrimonas sp. SM1919]
MNNSAQIQISQEYDNFYSDPWGHHGLVSYLFKCFILSLLLLTLWLSLSNSINQHYQQQQHTQRYSELQSFAHLISKNLKQKRNQISILASSKRLQDLIKESNSQNLNELKQFWHNLVQNSANLLAINYYDPQLNQILSVGHTSHQLNLNEQAQRNYSLQGIHSSGLTTVFKNGELISAIEMSVKLNNGGYLTVVFHFDEMISQFQPPVDENTLPILIFSQQGQLLSYTSPAGQTVEALSLELQSELDSELPQLLFAMTKESFGLYKDELFTFVFMKINLAGYATNEPWYYVVSYSKNSSELAPKAIANLTTISFIIFSFICFVLVTLLHLNSYLKRNQNHLSQLNQGLSIASSGLLYCSQHGKVIFANLTAANLLNINQHSIKDMHIDQLLTLPMTFEQLMTTMPTQSIPIFVAQKHLNARFRQINPNSASSNLYIFELTDHSEQVKLNNTIEQLQMANDFAQICLLVAPSGRICYCNHQAQLWLNSYSMDQNSSLKDLLLQFKLGIWPQIIQSCIDNGNWQGWVSGQGEDASGLAIQANGHFDEHGHLSYLNILLSPQKKLLPMIDTGKHQLDQIKLSYLALTEAQRINCKLILLRWDALQVSQSLLEQKLSEILPKSCHCLHYQENKLVIFSIGDDQNAYTLAQDIHYFITENFSNINLNIGIAGNQKLQPLEQLLQHAEVALKRSTQTPGMLIGQAYTRVISNT